MTTAAGRAGDSRFLSRIISTVGSSVELDEVLNAVVRLLSDASAVHACFVYLVEDGGDRLVLRAASDPYAGLAGEIALERGEGLAWWAAERRAPAFIRENALGDARVKYVPELEEERFQSLVCVPILGKDGDAIGVISLHTEAPREFSEAEADFLASSASLVGGAIQNARLYEDMRRRVAELEELTALADTIVRADTLEELAPAVVSSALDLLRARACRLYLLDAASELLVLRAALPHDVAAPPTIELKELGPELARSGRSARIAVPLVAGGELLGLLQADETAEVELARAVANQAAVAIEKIELIERLTEKNLIRDFFEQLAGGSVPGRLEERAARLGCDLDAPHVVVAAAPPSERLEDVLAAVAPGALADRREEHVQAIVRVPPGGDAALLDRLTLALRGVEPPASAGVSGICAGADAFRAGFEEAQHALLGTGVLRGGRRVVRYDELGPYKYLLRVALNGGIRDPLRDAVRRLVEYDEARSSALLETLEVFLRHRGTISTTADALHVHQNTLRQRLRRIMRLSGLDLRRDDWLMVELAVKTVRLQQALDAAPRPDAG